MGNCIQIIAPDGYEQLVADEPYHFLRNHADSKRVFLVYFEGYGTTQPKATLFSMERDLFELGLQKEALIRGRRQLAWPVDDNYLGRQDLNREGSEARVTVIS